MKYREFSPPAHLRRHVECFWHRAASPAPRKGLVLPDGCIDLIWMSGRDPFVAGPATTFAAPTSAAGTEIVGVRFRPGVAPALLRVNAQELLNRDVPLRDVWPQHLAERWEDAVARPTLAEKLEAIGDAIAKRGAAVDEPDALIPHVVAWLASHPRGSVAELAECIGLSERQIRRRVDEAVGYGPKTLQRILRLQRLLWLASRDPLPRTNLAGLAYAAGYANQPHMTRELRILAGRPPHQLLHGRPQACALSDFFKTRGA